MTRFMLLVICVLTCALLGLPASADDPPKKLTPEERKELEAKRTELNTAGLKAYQAGKYPEAVRALEDALEVARRIYNKVDFPDGHYNLAASLNNLAFLYKSQAKYADAEPLYKDALEMRKRLFKDKDHPDLAASLNNLAALYESQAKYADAEPLYKDALEMRKRLFKDKDHPSLATSLNNLAALYESQAKYADAEPLYKDALEMQKRLFKGDHLDRAGSLNNLALLRHDQGKLADAEPLYLEALAIYGRLFKGDHPDATACLNNLAGLYRDQGKLAEAEPLFRDALERRKRLFKGDHPSVALGLSNLAGLCQVRGKFADAESLSKDALKMSRRLTVAYAAQRSEGEALNLVAALPLYRDGVLALVRQRALDPVNSYDPATAAPALWAVKGTVARVYEQRQQQARAASADPALAKKLAELAGARRRRAELLLAPPTGDPGTLDRRGADLKALDETIAELSATLRKQLPAVARAERLNATTLAELQKALPAGAAVVDYFRSWFFEWDNARPAGEKQKWTERYLAFVVTRDKVAWVDLDTAKEIEPVIAAWRAAITSGKEIPVAVPTKVRELVWEKVRKALPAGTKTVYVCPDADLCKLPFGALPGDKPGTILLEDFAVATIPHAPFLLDQLWPKDPPKSPPSGALVVGGVKYDAEVSAPAPEGAAARGDPLVKPGAKLGWSFLDNTVGEANGFSAAAERQKMVVTRLERDGATTAAVLSALPKAKYAHFATHGFFADASFRGLFQLDEKDYERSRRGERIGRAANSPLMMTGLVFAGANNPKTPGRSILTGESLIDLDLSGLELAVLSACETGIGDVAGGEGTFGLQRAFHYAGTTNVVASLWKVPDASTAALMALFYRNLWEKNLSPMESLRQAQLEIYRNPGKIPELAKGFRGKFEEVPGMGGEAEIKPSKDGKAHPLLWAAFTLSGPGR